MVLQVQERLNAAIEARRRAGEDLAAPPKTAIAGPEYFGFNLPEVCSTMRSCSALARTLPVLL